MARRHSSQSFREYGNHLDRRVTRLESEVEAVANSVNQLGLEVHEFAEQTRREFAMLREHLNARMRPNWSMLISVVGLLVVLVGAVGSGFLAPVLTRLQALEERRVAGWVHESELEYRVETAQRITRMEAALEFLNHDAVR